MAKQYYCFLERFNNYFNRKLIKYDDFEDYIDNNHSNDYFVPTDANGNMTPFDFNPNDNITTEIICNDVPFDPDYFLLMDEDKNIVSRWFVLEQKRNRQGQWLYFLRRDVLADSYNQILNSPLFVERGIINDLDSPLLLNNEDVKVNQIKQQEILLKDKSYCAWLVMYLKKGVLGNSGIGPNHDGKIPIDVPNAEPYVYETLTVPIASWSLYQYTSTDYKYSTFDVFTIYFFNVLQNQSYLFKLWDDGSGNIDYGYTPDGRGNLSSNLANLRDRLSANFVPNASTMRTQALSAYGYEANSGGLWAYNDKIIKDSAGRYFKVRVYQVNAGSSNHDITTANAPTLKATITNLWNTSTGQSASPNDRAFTIKVNWISLRIELEELSAFQTVLDFGSFTGKGTKDSALFDVVCVPYGNIRITAQGGLIDLHTDAERSMSLMNSLATALTSQYVLDLQLLPYCPLQNLLTYSRISVKYLNDSAVQGIFSGDTTDLLLVADSVSFTFDINRSIDPPASPITTYPSYVKKYINDCTMVRLCSPNYNGVFEMSLAKNGGKINRFNIDVTLRPFNPYIHINPDFNFIYGTDFNDVRGLVCGGDFSLGIINDAWNVYEIQNKNYQAIFDRQIQNLDVNNAIARQEAGFGAVAGTVQGTASGAIAGGMVGGGYGAIAGAVIGGVASGIGGAMDYANLQKRQQEARSYAIDNYNLQLGNVRALPYSITKTSPFTNNNKLFPFVEIYCCTQEEGIAYMNKIRFNGMTVGKIGEMKNFTSDSNANYFRAKLIRITTISEDNHYVETINEELMKGVFI